MNSDGRDTMNRLRLALLLAVPSLVLVGLVAGMALWSLAQIGDPATDAGLARSGDGLVLVIMTDGGLAMARDIAIDLGLIAPLAILIPALGLSWFIAGRVHRNVASASGMVEIAEEERHTRLQEVVHELRTPLAIMGTNLELALQGAGEAEVRYVEAARRAMGRMARTVDDLAGHGQLAVEPGGGPLDLAACASDAVAEHVGPARGKGVNVVVGDSGPLIIPSADGAVVRTVLGNFLSNSVRLSPKGSEVRVDWGLQDGWAWIAVSDQGPGLAPHLHSRVFERGWQGQHDRNRATGAGGLGLTIARQLAEAQGGRVTIDSEEGGGATLAVWLPAIPEADQAAVVASDGVHSLTRPWLTTAKVGSF